MGPWFGVDSQIGVHAMRKFLAAAGLIVLVIIAGRGLKTEPELVFNWHGYRAGLDQAGTGGPPVGFQDLQAAGITHVGVPQDHTGDFGHRDYIADIGALGIKVIRTMEQRWNAGLFGRDLGGIILAWESAEEPGDFFVAYRDNLRGPCDGIGWNLEHDILSDGKYPVTTADRKLADIWGMDIDGEAGYVAFRGRQFALLFQMYFDIARRQFPECELAIGYSGYAGLESRGMAVAAAYGVDWGALGEGQVWRGYEFAPITHAMCAWHTSVELPAAARGFGHGLPVIHTIALAPALRGDDDFRRQIRDRLGLLRAGDGIGTVEHGVGPVWDGEDARVHRLLGEVLAPTLVAEK